MNPMKMRLNVKFRIEACRLLKKVKSIKIWPGWAGAGHICHPSTESGLEGSQKDQPAHGKQAQGQFRLQGELKVSLGCKGLHQTNKTQQYISFSWRL